MKQSLQLTNSVILERQIKMTVQSKRKQKTRNFIGRLIAEQLKSAQKRGYPAKTYVKHDSTRGFKCKSFQIDDTNRLADYVSHKKMSLNWNDTEQKEICRRKSGRMAERSKAPDSRNSSVENSGTRVCAWVRIPLLLENVLNTMKQSPQQTNSVILELQFKMTVQSKRKQKTRNFIGRLIAEQLKSAQKRGYPAKTYVKHDSTRGFKCKSFQIDDTNRLADYVSHKKMSLNWNDTDQKEICRRKSGRMAERSKAPDSRNSSVENSGTRVCAWVRIPLLLENVLNTMKQSPQQTNSVILELQFKMTVQSKRKQKTRNVIGRLIAELLKSAQKRGWRRRHVKHDSTRGFKCKSFQIDDTNRLADYVSHKKMSLNWKDTDQKEICRRKTGRMAERSKAPDSRNSSVENSGTRVCAWVRIPLLLENVLNTMKQSPQLTNSVILELQFKMTVQSKRKQKTRNVIGRLIAELFKSAQKRGYPAKTCETRLNAWV